MERPEAKATKIQMPKLLAQTTHGRNTVRVLTSLLASAGTKVVRRGRAISSPPQFGQWWCKCEAHSGQKVHSNEQIYASSVGERLISQRSQRVFIARGILKVVPYPESLLRPCQSFAAKHKKVFVARNSKRGQRNEKPGNEEPK